MSGLVADDPEYWVLRVVPMNCCEGARSGVHGLTCRTHELTAAGDLAYVGGELVEPVEVYTTEDAAMRRARAEAARTGQTYKVTLVLDLDL